MAKCSIVGCTDAVVGGFEEKLDVGHFQAPTATAPGPRTHWCEEHKRFLSRGLGGGRYLSQNELRSE